MARCSTLPLLMMLGMAMADEPPAMPDVGDYKSEAVRQQSSSKIEAVTEASRSGAVRTMPEIIIKKQGVDIDQIASRYRQMGSKRQDESLLIFVSTSMPMAALVKLGKQARDAGAIMLLRGIPGGLGKGSWGQAMAKLKPVIETGASIQIHPDMFRLYGVEQVPTFVMAKASQSGCALDSTRCQEFLKASGDVTLDYVLDRWADGTGDLAEKSRDRLSRLRRK